MKHGNHANAMPFWKQPIGNYDYEKSKRNIFSQTVTGNHAYLGANDRVIDRF